MIRLANENDILAIMEIINDAKILLKNNGLLQWNTDSYPNIETIDLDIKLKRLYVYEENKLILGCEVLMEKPDPNYEKIYDGNWLGENNYISIHRIAVKAGHHGKKIGEKLIYFALEYAKKINFQSVRVDTHKDNLRMRKILENSGFTKCGTIILLRTKIDNLRIGYEKRVN